MKKILIILLCIFIVLGLVGCKKSNEVLGDEPLTNHAEPILTIKSGNKSCVYVQLVLYEDGKYELFTEYEACRSLEICNLALKYTKSIKGIYNYDIKKIIENSVDASDKTYSMDNLPEYEMSVGNSYVEEGYSYKHVVEKGQTNKYLDEFLKEMDINLKVCASPYYID